MSARNRTITLVPSFGGTGITSPGLAPALTLQEQLDAAVAAARDLSADRERLVIENAELLSQRNTAWLDLANLRGVLERAAEVLSSGDPDGVRGTRDALQQVAGQLDAAGIPRLEDVPGAAS